MTLQPSSTDVLIEGVTTEVRELSAWFEETLLPVTATDDADQISAWRHELGIIHQLVGEPTRTRIALIGTTGAGKSTFLNAVLRQEVLPVGVMHPCTAFVTSVSFAPGPDYTLSIHYATREEWQRDVEAFASVLEPGEAGDDAGEQVESSRMLDIARKRLQGVYGDAILEATSPGEVLSAPLPEAAEDVFSSPPVLETRFDDAKEMLSHLRGLIRGESPLWPLVREVSIKGPYEALRGGLELVDLPGLNDPNEARVEVTREYLRTSPFVWLIFPMVRGITADIQRILREEKIFRTLVLNGTYSGLALVGTKADEIDMDSADQLGLSEDCEFSELVEAYRAQTVAAAREQLEEVVRGLPGAASAPETHRRMLEMARSVRVHTTSASAYNKLVGVGRLRKDYGLDDEDETGIPGIHEHLREISQEAGADFNARAAQLRAAQLRQEIEFYFRAKGEASSPNAERARATFREQADSFAADITRFRERANEQLELQRERFVERLDPLFESSARGVTRATEGWRGLYWSTLRAIVQRDGVFRSPSTGRSHDLNGDISEPFLSELPVSWEKYFTDDLGGVTNELVVRVQEAGKAFCEKIDLAAKLLAEQSETGIDDQLGWFRQKVALLADETERHVNQEVSERRGELATKLPVIAKQRMQPAYDRSKDERGPGMKGRILDHLESTARKSAQPMYATLQSMILEGLGDLELAIVGLYGRLAEASVEQSKIIVNNANVGLNESMVPAPVAAALASMPKGTAS